MLNGWDYDSLGVHGPVVCFSNVVMEGVIG